MIQEGFGLHGLTADQYFAEVSQFIHWGNPVCFEPFKNIARIHLQVCVFVWAQIWVPV